MSKRELLKERLLSKLDWMDDRLVNIWLEDESSLSDDDKWEIFAVLLESRVALVKTCQDAGLALKADQVLPPWLERLTDRQKEVRLRELKLLSEQLKTRKIHQAYERIAESESDL
jgi:hypothetical protein